MTLLDPDVFCEELQRVLAECGIALVYLPHLKGSFLQGATFYDGNRIVMGLTVRGKDADRFWFSMFHELAHIVLGHIGSVDEMTDEHENQADTWAENTLIDIGEFENFCVSGDFSRYSVIRFAEKQGIDAGIVVGRLQRKAIINHNMLNDLKQKYDNITKQ
jgi:HTH-type transcriptional regulator/antitoxin HigA